MLLLVGAILAGSILVALGAARVGVPSLVAFLALGMLLGSDGPGGIYFDDVELARASLTGADLSGAMLERGKLSGATCDATTKWPEGFDPKAERARLRSLGST